MEKLIDDALNVAKEIKESDDFKELKRLSKLINEKYFLYISAFNIAKENLENARPLGRDSNIYKEAREKYLEKKDALYKLEEVIKYKRLEKKIQGNLDDITEKIKEIL